MWVDIFKIRNNNYCPDEMELVWKPIQEMYIQVWSNDNLRGNLR